jgi:hypothetical protein
MQSRPPILLRSLRVSVHLGLGLMLLAALCVVMAGVSLYAHAASDATLTVTDCSGETGPGRIGTVISSASPGDTITFSCSGTIPITSTLTITKNLTLNGSGQNVTLDGGNSVQVLFVNSGVTFTLNALTIAHGSTTSGGGLFNEGGTVSISKSTFATNSATGTFGEGGGLANHFGTMTISNSTFATNSATGEGGGLMNFPPGTMTISNSTFATNSAGHGGGLENDGTMTISNSTFATNSASLTGGGLFNGNTVSITNSTFATNSAGATAGGIYNDGGTSATTVNIGGSILANNARGNCAENFPGTITSAGYNLESGTDCGFTGTGDLQNTDPKLGPLASNGGPTQTMALLKGSPAIDYIPLSSSICPTTDQRGHKRPDNPRESACDIGAYEA